MKGYLIKLFVFSIPIFVLASLMELSLRYIPNDFQKKKEYLDINSDRVEVLVLGGSHTLYGINPVLFKEVSFNASQVSQSLDLDLALLNKYKKSWSKLGYIILPVSYSTLFEKLEKSLEPWRMKNYCIYYQIPVTNHFPYYFEIFSNNLATNLRRFNSYYLLKNNNINCTLYGWDSTYSFIPETRDLFKAGEVAAKLHRWEDDQYFDEMISSMDSIITFAKKQNCEILLFTPPAFFTYRKNLDNTQLSRTINTASKFTEKYVNCYYVNLLEDSSFTEEHFFDSDHLNKAGAEKLSLMLDSIIYEIKNSKVIH